MAMEEQFSLDEQYPIADSAPAPKRRKLRKGTQSCWECKRRKAKCTFSSDAVDVCDSCKRRGTDCVSQDASEKPPAPGSNKHLVDRLGEVEALVQHLLKTAHHKGSSDDGLISPAKTDAYRRSHRDESRRSKSPGEHSNPAIFSSQSNVASQNGGSAANPSTANTPLSEDSWPSMHPEEPTSAPEPHDALRRDLLTAWPSPDDMKIILSIPLESSQIIRALTCAPPKDRGSKLPSPSTLLQLPPRGSHPVLVARKMLILATFLQGVPIASESYLERLGTSREELMSRMVKTAHDLVTCNDDLVSSLEGIECIMLEGLYENYAGNLRRSWLAARRAVMIAQILGLNRGIVPSSIRGAAIEPDDLWFRLINFDRYLCLMLGLPQSSPGEPFARSDALDTYPANQRMQRLCSIACGRLLNRDPSDVYNQHATEEIDKLLRDACTSMPAQWWIMPNLSSYCDLPDKIRETLRFNDHFMQYHLLLQLHLPYLLRPNIAHSWSYNKSTAIAACREILTRFISVRTVPQARYYCRGTDLIAFMSCAALTIAHILCDQRHKKIEDNGYHFLTQQRLSDRGLLEQVLAIAQDVMHKNNDDVSKRLLMLLHYLLAIEDNVTAGVRYSVSFAEESARDGDLGHHVKASEDGTLLNIHLPHFQMIKIERRGSEGEEVPASSLEVPMGTAPAKTNERDTDDTATNETLQDISLTQPAPFTLENVSGVPVGLGKDIDAPLALTSAEDTWTLEGFDMSFLDNYIGGTGVI
ncbi:hypothetical protein FSARC_3617 [Fusarium sarcochroum]|uniref:Zn(2)-C6 fungal-type domain-containing protein n=1 Tax=Fusarium sarcochroum TaxID=1208366 RepID=A0A8H4XCG0_9HYPO|nr:hypothetical protein FSARC_3617 [Fusarium sarcochroum]